MWNTKYTITAGTLNQYTAPDNTFVGDVNITSGKLKNSSLISCSGSSCSWSGSSINTQGWKGFDINIQTRKDIDLDIFV